MTPDELTAALVHLWPDTRSHAERERRFSDLTGVRASTIHAWRMPGRNPVPPWVPRMLALLEKVRDMPKA